MERQIKWHYWPMSDDEYRQALDEIGANGGSAEPAVLAPAATGTRPSPNAKSGARS
jgi:hypothetical protein